ncbi:MAG TPA: hypothetical protein PKI77_09730 [Mycobacterium sp.]|nr:hypothetical protein [Mycobacterium sp.]
MVEEITMNMPTRVVTFLPAVLSALTIGVGPAAGTPSALAAPPVLSLPAGVGFTFEWDSDDDDDDWPQTATWECPVGCSIVWDDPP